MHVLYMWYALFRFLPELHDTLDCQSTILSELGQGKHQLLVCPEIPKIWGIYDVRTVDNNSNNKDTIAVAKTSDSW